MKQTDLRKRMREMKFTDLTTLSQDQKEKMIKEKLERAERFLRADKVQKERTLQP